MKPDWDRLMKEFNPTSKSGLIADVDCTVEKDLCSTHGVQGYPTIKYGSVSSLEDYKGGRDFDSLLTFAKENLGPSCGPENLDLCSDEEKAGIKKLQEMPEVELDAAIASKEKEIEDAEALFKEEADKLQKEYTALDEAKQATEKAVKDSGLGRMKAVLAYKKKFGCRIEDGDGCSEKEKKYLKKWEAKDIDEINAQLTRLGKMSSGKMKPSLKEWMEQRVHILRLLATKNK